MYTKFTLFSALLISLQLSAQNTPITQPNLTNGQRLDEIFTYIDKLYVDDVNNKELMDAAIVSMLEKLDPHSVYIPKEEVDQANVAIDGSFVGVGIRFQILKDTLMVVEAISGGPSEKLGIRAGDKIISVDGNNIAGIGLKNSQVREKLLGELGSKVRIDIIRKATPKPLNFVITRDKIPVNSVDCAFMVSPKIGYLKLTSFSRTSHEEVRKGITKLKAEGMESLIFDLQGNGGGLLYVAQQIADEFLSDEKLIVYSEGRAQPRTDLKAGRKGLWETGKLIVLIDDNSASASEIVSGAIQDWDRGLIIGRRSYGKGLVQRPIDLSDGSQIRLTIARYFTPTGRFIQRPYEDISAYKNEYMRRFMHGEFTHIDSIKLPDSLKFETRISKRPVYGGGGIMPDFFVPIDTMEISDMYRDISQLGFFNSFCLTYVNTHRDEFEKKYSDNDHFIKEFTVTDKIMDEFFETLKKENNDFKYSETDYKRSENLIKIRIKGMIANDMYGIESFYKVFNVENEILQKGINILETNEYDKQNLAKN